MPESAVLHQLFAFLPARCSPVESTFIPLVSEPPHSGMPPVHSRGQRRASNGPPSTLSGAIGKQSRFQMIELALLALDFGKPVGSDGS